VDENYDELWKMGAVFDKLSDACAISYSLSKHLAVGGMIVLFKGAVIIQQCIPKKHKWFWIKVLCLQCDCVFRHRWEMCSYSYNWNEFRT
jgi:hypothetical protein